MKKNFKTNCFTLKIFKQLFRQTAYLIPSKFTSNLVLVKPLVKRINDRPGHKNEEKNASFGTQKLDGKSEKIKIL